MEVIHLLTTESVVGMKAQAQRFEHQDYALAHPHLVLTVITAFFKLKKLYSNLLLSSWGNAGFS